MGGVKNVSSLIQFQQYSSPGSGRARLLREHRDRRWRTDLSLMRPGTVEPAPCDCKLRHRSVAGSLRVLRKTGRGRAHYHWVISSAAQSVLDMLGDVSFYRRSMSCGSSLVNCSFNCSYNDFAISNSFSVRGSLPGSLSGLSVSFFTLLRMAS